MPRLARRVSINRWPMSGFLSTRITHHGSRQFDGGAESTEYHIEEYKGNIKSG
jgi:hypothetical protein